MKGAGLMVMIVSSAIAAMACQGCVQTSRHAHAVAYSPPSPLTAPSADLRGNIAGAPEMDAPIAYSSTIEVSQSMPRLAFEPPATYSGPIELSDNEPFGASKLYSGELLTTLAADREWLNINSVPRENKNLSAELSFSAPSSRTGFGFDVGVSPRVSITHDGPFAVRRVGGEVRIGQNFDKRGDGGPASSWYLFAGADGEALVWEPDQTGSAASAGMGLHDKVTVGDVQAGISFEQGPGQLSVSYIRREVEYRERNLGASEVEDFAGISFTIRK